MTQQWQEMLLGEVLTLQRGFDLPMQERKIGTVPVVSSSGISGTHSEARAIGPGVVTGRYGTIGEVFYVEQDYWPLNTTLFVRDFKDNDPRYVSYLLRTLDFQAHNDKSSVPGVNRNHLHLIKVSVAPLPEQRAIAHILGTLDDTIDLNRRMNQTLEALARAIFTSWFVDFDPVRAKAAGRQPEGMDAETAALFPSAFEQVGGTEVPAGWSLPPFTEAVEIIGGGTPQTSNPEYWGGSIPWFSVVDTPRESDCWVIDTEKKITPLGLASSATRLLAPGTTIISARGTVGRVALVGVDMAMNQSCYGLRGRAPLGPLYTFFATRNLVATLRQRTHGSVFDTITRATLQSVRAVVPSSDVAGLFESAATPLLDRILGNLQESQALAEMRDTLLPKLLSGEVRVGDLERLSEATP